MVPVLKTENYSCSLNLGHVCLQFLNTVFSSKKQGKQTVCSLCFPCFFQRTRADSL